MKKFEQLHAHDQIVLLAAGLEAMAEAGGEKTIEAVVARLTGRSALQWWSDLCADSGLDECEPWPGFPIPCLSMSSTPRNELVGPTKQ